MSTSDRWEALIEDHLDGVLDPRGEQELAGLLASSADARKLLAAHMRVHGTLCHLGKAGVLKDKSEEPGVREDKPAAAPRPRRVALLAGLAACLAVMGGYWLLSIATKPARVIIAKVDEARGASRRSGGPSSDLREGAPIFSGERISTTDIAIIGFPDGTKVAADERSDVTFSLDDGAKHFDLHAGVLRFDVAKQPVGKPLVVLTPHAKVIVVGTRFLIESSNDFTEVEVEEGTLRLEAKNGGQPPVEAKIGEIARVDQRGRITNEPRPAAGDARPSRDTLVYWDVDKKRVHVDGCKRLAKDPRERAKMTTMTLVEAERKGIPLCSRCPGSATPGKGSRK